MSPANWTDSVSVEVAGRVAEPGVVLLVSFAGERRASCAPIAVLGTGDADVSHAVHALGRANATAECVEAFSANRVPEKAVLLAVVALVD